MELMSSKRIKDHYGEFVDTALEALPSINTKKNKSLLDFAGAGISHSKFQSTDEVDTFIHNLRNEWD